MSDPENLRALRMLGHYLNETLPDLNWRMTRYGSDHLIELCSPSALTVSLYAIAGDYSVGIRRIAGPDPYARAVRVGGFNDPLGRVWQAAADHLNQHRELAAETANDAARGASPNLAERLSPSARMGDASAKPGPSLVGGTPMVFRDAPDEETVSGLLQKMRNAYIFAGFSVQPGGLVEINALDGHSHLMTYEGVVEYARARAENTDVTLERAATRDKFRRGIWTVREMVDIDPDPLTRLPQVDQVLEAIDFLYSRGRQELLARVHTDEKTGIYQFQLMDGTIWEGGGVDAVAAFLQGALSMFVQRELTQSFFLEGDEPDA